MPFLAMSGRLNFGRFHVAGSGGGAYFDGDRNGLDYTLWYYTVDVRVAYDVTKGEKWSSAVSAGFTTESHDSEKDTA